MNDDISIEERIWLLQYRAIVDLIGAAALSAPNALEAKKRLDEIRCDMANIESDLVD